MSALAGLLLAAAAAGSVLALPPEAAVPELAWASELVGEALPRELLRIGAPAVLRDDRLRAQEALGLPPAPLSRATSLRLAEALGASRVVVGRIERDPAGITLSLRLLDVERATLSAPLRASGAPETLPQLVRSLARDVALAGPRPPADPAVPPPAAEADPPLEALRAFGEALAGSDAAARRQKLRRALALSPGFDAARLALARHELQAREAASALETLGRVPPDAPLGREARFLSGVALLELGRYREAAALYAALVAQSPTAAALNNHALALLRSPARGDYRASDVLRKAVELEPASADLTFNLGFALLSEKAADAAAFWLRGLVRQHPRDAHARLVLSWALRQGGPKDEAEEAWRGLLAVAPSYAAASAPDLSRRFERPAPSERLLVLDADTRGDAELVALHLGRAEKARAARDADAERRELARALALDPYDARAHLLLARAHLARGDRDQALAELRVSLYCRDDPGVRLELAGLLNELGRGAEARAEAERVLRAEPGNDAARRLLARP